MSDFRLHVFFYVGQNVSPKNSFTSKFLRYTKTMNEKIIFNLIQFFYLHLHGEEKLL